MKRRQFLTFPCALFVGLLGVGCGGGGGSSGKFQSGEDPETPLKIPRILSQPKSQVVVTGAMATFSVVAEGQSLSYQWQRDGVNILNATGSSFTSGAVTLLDDGAIFSVSVENTAGAVVSDTAILTVDESSITVDATTISVDSVSLTIDQV